MQSRDNVEVCHQALSQGSIFEERVTSAGRRKKTDQQSNQREMAPANRRWINEERAELDENRYEKPVQPI